jgi:NitT/TauT family transport system permease protein
VEGLPSDQRPDRIRLPLSIAAGLAGGDAHRMSQPTMPDIVFDPSAVAPDEPAGPTDAGDLPPRYSSVGVRGEISRRTYVALGVSLFVFLAALWCILSYGRHVSSVFLPTPTAVAKALGTLWSSDLLTKDLWLSNVRILTGFALATVVAVPLGMLAGNLRPVEALLDPFLGFVRYMPVPAFIPLLMLYTGIGETPKVLVIFIGTVVQMIVMVADVTKQTPADLLRAAQVLGATRWELFRRVIWPASLPGILDVCRMNLGWAWTYLVVAELVAANVGLGYRILKAQRFLQTDVIFLYIFIIGLLGVGSDLLFKFAGRLLFPWSRQRVRSE